MMRMRGALAVCVMGALLWLLAPRAMGATDDTDTLPAPRKHSGTAPVRSAPLGSQAEPTGAEGADDPEARPVTHYRKPGTRASVEEDSGSLVMNIAGKLALVVALILACAA